MRICTHSHNFERGRAISPACLRERSPGFHIDSHMPNSCSVQVPETTNPFDSMSGIKGAPMKSEAKRYGLFSESKPAITGCRTKEKTVKIMRTLRNAKDLSLNLTRASWNLGKRLGRFVESDTRNYSCMYTLHACSGQQRVYAYIACVLCIAERLMLCRLTTTWSLLASCQAWVLIYWYSWYICFSLKNALRRHAHFPGWHARLRMLRDETHVHDVQGDMQKYDQGPSFAPCMHHSWLLIRKE